MATAGDGPGEMMRDVTLPLQGVHGSGAALPGELKMYRQKWQNNPKVEPKCHVLRNGLNKTLCDHGITFWKG